MKNVLFIQHFNPVILKLCILEIYLHVLDLFHLLQEVHDQNQRRQAGHCCVPPALVHRCGLCGQGC